ncbi:hypothetical protein [Hymenobacter lapidiphilus]|uniref:Uncharacterized protein n=1 Tax=Hymenobacter lapidiphilus TaxID=2608003 RepID=A0A7Y7PSS4_9BACT|nr:hypothetical protein [Hymenobacter lapidiphilus]NVO33202.1 hypothetical protein [Hymenobacter lapidiphilus]
MASVDDPTQTLTCAARKTPDVTSECIAQLVYGPIGNLYLTIAPFAAVPTAVEVARRLAIVAPDDPERMTLLIATLSIPAGATQSDRFNGIDYAKPGDQAYAIKTLDLTTKNLDFARSTQQYPWVGRIYGVGQGDLWYGGQDGMQGSVRLSHVVPEDETAPQSLEGPLTTRSFFTPKRLASPIPLVYGAR